MQLPNDASLNNSQAVEHGNGIGKNAPIPFMIGQVIHIRYSQSHAWPV